MKHDPVHPDPRVCAPGEPKPEEKATNLAKGKKPDHGQRIRESEKVIDSGDWNQGGSPDLARVFKAAVFERIQCWRNPGKFEGSGLIGSRQRLKKSPDHFRMQGRKVCIMKRSYQKISTPGMESAQIV
jgi:hypothetical protein